MRVGGVEVPRFLTDDHRKAHVAALKREMAEYEALGLYDRILQVIEQIELAGGSVEEEVKLKAAAALKLEQRKHTAAGPPPGAQTRGA